MTPVDIMVPHYGRVRLRRMAPPSSVDLLSMTRVSG